MSKTLTTLLVFFVLVAGIGLYVSIRNTIPTATASTQDSPDALMGD